MIWNNKKYVSKPLLVKEDSAIQKHRRWFSQFYSENSPRLQHRRDTLDFWPPRTAEKTSGQGSIRGPRGGGVQDWGYFLFPSDCLLKSQHQTVSPSWPPFLSPTQVADVTSQLHTRKRRQPPWCPVGPVEPTGACWWTSTRVQREQLGGTLPDHWLLTLTHL